MQLQQFMLGSLPLRMLKLPLKTSPTRHTSLSPKELLLPYKAMLVLLSPRLRKSSLLLLVDQL
jgi:hypothetical protein